MSGSGETTTGYSNEFPPSPPSSDSSSPPPKGSSPSLEQNLLLPNSSSKSAPPPLNSSSSSPPLRSSKSPPPSQLPPESGSKAVAPAPPLDVGSPPPSSPQGSSSKNPSPPLDYEAPKASPPPPTPRPPPLSNSKLSPPPPSNSKASPPPPSNSEASPPPPSNSKASPPPPSNSKASPSPPPSNSKASPPPPPSHSKASLSPPSNSKASPPPPPSHSKALLSPPSNSKASPPSPSVFPPPPPPSPDEQSPSPSVSQSSPPTPAPPPADDDASPAKQSPPPASPPVSPRTPTSSPEPSSSLPQKSNPSPPTELCPRTVSQSSPPPRSSPHGQTLSHPSNTKNESSSSKGSSSSSPGSSVSSGTLIGVAVAGVVLIAVIAVFLLTSRRKRRPAQIYSSHYMAPNKVSVTSDGYYNHQQQAMGNNGGDVYYQSSIASSYGSQRGNVHQRGAPDASGIGNAKSFFSYEELTEITGGFSHENVLGEGGFGCVYKGWLPDGRVVAVKQLRAGSGQGEREFRAEVEIISRVHHRHLVSLVGYCISENQRLLIYEFVPNITLEHHLHGQGMPVLDWTKRLKIAVGAAKGLAYLHEDCHPKIIHRDIKSANILLDDAFEAQVADFGLAKLANDTNTHVSTRIMGTFGYLAPEYASSGKLTDRSDVYSFGVVLLELVTGRKPVDATQPLGDESLVEWARPLLIHALETCDFGELVDPRLEKQYVESEMFRMIEAAAACVRHSAPKRPRMAQVVRALDSEAEMSDLSNGVKYGQSTTYDSGQYNQEITRFRRMALGSNGSGYAFSGEYNSREMSGSQSSWKPQDNSSGESETRAINGQSGEQKYSGAQGSSLGHRF